VELLLLVVGRMFCAKCFLGKFEDSSFFMMVDRFLGIILGAERRNRDYKGTQAFLIRRKLFKEPLEYVFRDCQCSSLITPIQF
jgi:hypothetical protein